MKPFTTLAVFVLAVVAVGQALRFALAWPVIINGFPVPLWASALACLVTGGIAFMLWRETRR